MVWDVFAFVALAALLGLIAWRWWHDGGWFSRAAGLLGVALGVLYGAEAIEAWLVLAGLAVIAALYRTDDVRRRPAGRRR